MGTFDAAGDILAHAELQFRCIPRGRANERKPQSCLLDSAQGRREFRMLTPIFDGIGRLSKGGGVGQGIDPSQFPPPDARLLDLLFRFDQPGRGSKQLRSRGQRVGPGKISGAHASLDVVDQPAQDADLSRQLIMLGAISDQAPPPIAHQPSDLQSCRALHAVCTLDGCLGCCMTGFTLSGQPKRPGDGNFRFATADVALQSIVSSGELQGRRRSPGALDNIALGFGPPQC